MAKATEKDLEKIELDIQKAQEKLEWINQAINRDQLLCETKSKDIDVLLETEKKLISKLEEIEKKVCDNEKWFETLKNRQQEEISLLWESKKQLEADITASKEKLQSLEKNYIQSEATFHEKAVKLSQEYEELVKSVEEDKGTFDGNRVLMWKEIEKLRLEVNNLTSKKEQLLETVEFLKTKEAMSNIILEEVAQNSKTLQEIEYNIGELEKKQQEIGNSIKSMTWETNTLKEWVASLKSELNILEANKAVYVQQKLQLKNEKAELEARELYIKNKYSEAGLQY